MVRLYLSMLRAFRQPNYDLNVNIARNLACLFLVYKLLSRDYGFYGTLPDEFFSYYPVSIYKPENFILLTGIPILTDILTFHWIHVLLPYPSVFGMRLIQGICIIFLVMTAIFGRGPKRLWIIGSYALLVYLWGFLILAAQEVDAIFLYFGIILVISISVYDDRPIWQWAQLASLPANKTAGLAFSSLIAVFAVYYFSSGFNKLTDIPLLQFFSSDILGAIRFFTIRDLNGYIEIPDVLSWLSQFDIWPIDIFGPFLVYASHLGAPLVIWFRNQIPKFALFYCAFHFLVFGVGISFTGYIFAWLLIMPHLQILRSFNRSRPKLA